MQLFYGSYGAITQGFLDFVQKNRKSPLEKWLVVCASSLMAQTLKKQLAKQYGALANIHFTTLSSLLTRLDSEAGPALPLLPQDHLRSFLIKELLTTPLLNRYPVSLGFVEAVKSSLLDLGDSCVDASVWEEYVRTLPDEVLEQEGDRLFWLISLYRQYQAAEAKVKGYRSYQQAYERALAQVEKSAYLHDFKQIVFYGFYELSGRQLDLVREVRVHYPATVFAPYEKIPAYRFAQKFFETNWLSAQAKSVPATPTALGKSGPCLFDPTQSASCPRVQLVSAPDLASEVFFTAKEILRLTQEKGYAWGDIGIIARNTAPYQDEIRRLFAANYIPLDAAFVYPLTHYALGKFCVDLFALEARGFERESVLKILSSPYFKHPRKQEWVLQVRRSLVNRDLSQWNDLLPQVKNYDPALLTWLSHTAEILKNLSHSQPWKQGVETALQFLKATLDEQAFEGKDREIFQAVCNSLETISLYSVLRAKSHPGELVKEIDHALRTLSFNEASAVEGGVVFTDALRARGLCFKVVFVWGLNDASFPLVTPEDPILRDYYRYMLRDVLGYWINQSLQRGEEEKLLFYTALTAAQKQVYVSCARAGTDGKEKVPSLFMAELARAVQQPFETNRMWVSGIMRERLAALPCKHLTEKELSCLISFDSKNALKNYRKSGLLTPEKQTSVEAAAQLRQTTKISARDGKIQSGAALFAQQNKRGFSASALKKLAACPLAYFFDKGLKLGEEDEPLSRQELSADRRGVLIHAILCDFYQTLYKRGQTHNLFESGLREQLHKSALRCAPAQGGRSFGIYPLMWELIWEDLVQTLSDFVVEDDKHLGPFTPAMFERNLTCEPTAKLPLRFYGVLDRVDLNQSARQFCIVDYKSSYKGTLKLEEDLFHHLILQPFLYAWMATHHPDFAAWQFEAASLISICDGYRKRDLTAATWQAISPRATSFFTFLGKLIKKGDFFLHADENECRFCPYGAMCRRDSYQTLLRLKRSKVAQELEEARQ